MKSLKVYFFVYFQMCSRLRWYDASPLITQKVRGRHRERPPSALLRAFQVKTTTKDLHEIESDRRHDHL